MDITVHGAFTEIRGRISGVCTEFGAGFAGVVAALVLWIVYWVKIAEYSRMLDVPVQMGIQA